MIGGGKRVGSYLLPGFKPVDQVGEDAGVLVRIDLAESFFEDAADEDATGTQGPIRAIIDPEVEDARVFKGPGIFEGLVGL